MGYGWENKHSTPPEVYAPLEGGQTLTSAFPVSKEAGMAAGEFHTVSKNATVNLIGAMLNGLMRQRGLKFGEVEGIKETTVEFCRRSLTKTGFEHI